MGNAPDVEIVTDATSRLDRALNPAQLNARLMNSGVDECVREFNELKSVAATTIVDLFICIGRAARSIGAKGGEKGDRKKAESLAKSFTVSVGFIYRAINAYESIIEKRIAQQGDAAAWPIDQVSYYFISVDAAAKLERPALELLEQAEESFTSDPTYTVRRFREDLGLSSDGDEGSTTNEGAAFSRACAKLAEIDHAQFVEWAASGRKPKKELDRARDALTALTDAVKELGEKVEKKPRGRAA